MSGTYQGTYHGGNDFTNESVREVHENLKANALLNGSGLAFVTEGWSPAGISLSVGHGPGNGSAASNPATVTGGPAAGTVGASGSVRSGNAVVVVPPTKWTPGGSLMFGGHALSMKDAGKVSVQPLTIGGLDIQSDRGWSDAGDVEQRLGESELFSPAWFYSWGVTYADAKKTVEVAGPVVAGAYVDDARRIGAQLMTKGAGAAAAVNRAMGQWAKTVDVDRLPSAPSPNPYAGQGIQVLR